MPSSMVGGQVFDEFGRGFVLVAEGDRHPAIGEEALELPLQPLLIQALHELKVPRI